MITPQDSRFWQAAVRSGLLDMAALQKAWDAIEPGKRTFDAADRRLARQLVNTGVLTLWQAQQILAGRWQGLRIDKYELKDIIGQGGMGRVYLARDVRLDRMVALKILARDRMNNARALARFRREAKVGAQLQHENLVRIYDEGEAYGVRYLVMEYIEGKTVGRLISELGALPPLTAADIARKVAMGLDHLHQKGLLHRDVNPMNILIDRDGTAKLTDLGLAIDLGDDDVVTRDGATVGTFDYISPEQAKHSRMVDARADIYSLGCTLYHMISGRVPFPTPSLPEKLYAHQLSEPEPLSHFAPDVPGELTAIVSKMMRKSPDDRFRRASDVVRALEPLAKSSLSASRIASGGSTTLEATALHPMSSGSHSPMGSDPDFAYQQPPPQAQTPVTPPTDPLDFFMKISLDPEPSLSGTRSSVKSKSRSGEAIWKPRSLRGLVVGIVGGASTALILGGIIYWLFLSRSTSDDRPALRTPGLSVTPSAPGDIVVRFPNGETLSPSSLREAIQRLSGAGGEITLKSKRVPLDAGPGPTLRLGSGHLRIKSEDGLREIRVELTGSAPWLEVAPTARLTLSNISVRAEAVLTGDGQPNPASPPILISANGPVSLERAEFSTTGRDRSIRALAARGIETRVSGCLFDGFDQPIALDLYANAQAKISQCIFVRDRVNVLAGWAISASRPPGASSPTPRLTIDRCTFVGSGVLSVGKVTPENPLAVMMTNSAIQTNSLLMTKLAKDKLAVSLPWKGRENVFSLNSAAWVLTAPTAFESIADGPSDFKGWTELYPAEESSEARPIPFAGKSLGEGKGVEDLKIPTEPGKPAFGADPDQVGPLVKP